MSDALKFDVDTHFGFGQNWIEFARHIDDQRIEQSIEGIAHMLGTRDLGGKAVLDIGCGCGIQSLAMLRMGAEHVYSVDIDPDAVRTAKHTIERFGDGSRSTVEQQNIFEMPEVGPFDVVYSWGTLHHTGDMWGAVRAASRFVKPGGILAIALYRKTRWCGFWAWEKKRYVESGPIFRQTALWTYLGLKVARDLIHFRNPIERFRGYREKRGMHWYVSAVDSVGGYPYESASAEEVQSFVESLGFELKHAHKTRPSTGFLGSGNAEYRFRRRAAAAGA